MPRIAAAVPIDQIVHDAIRPVVARASEQIARSMANMVAERLEAELRRSVRPAPAQTRKRGRSSRRGEITKWVADRRARRVPTFVIQATGLDTKKKIVAKYGPKAVFEKSKRLPKAK